MAYGENDKWPIAERFRASADITDEQAYAMLLKCDAEQAELAKKVGTPFASQTPLERQRGKALITLQSLMSVSRLTSGQQEQAAEAFAALGRYDLAAEMTLVPSQKSLYEDYWVAVFKPDESTCPHPVQHQYLECRVFSLKHGREKSLIRCNIPSCGFINVTSTPDEIKAHNKQTFGGK